MTTQTQEHVLQLSETGRLLMCKALGEFIMNHIGSSRIPGSELADAMQLLTVIDNLPKGS